MQRLQSLTLVFAVVSAVLFLLLVFFRIPFPAYPLMSVQDAADLLTPLALIPLYWVLFKMAGEGFPRPAEEIAFMVLAALWAMGHGMHLAANSISNLIDALPEPRAFNAIWPDIHNLTYFLDEHLSHYAWHGGVLGLAALLIYREWRQPGKIATSWWPISIAALIYGFTYFCIVLEGQTVPLGLPFAIVICLLGLTWGRQRLRHQPLLAFFFLSCSSAAILLAGWGLYWRGFPQFTDIGLFH